MAEDVARYRVEELAEASGVAVDTVRYYQRRKLLAPPLRDGRVAIYDKTHLERIREIRALAERGFTLAQIKDLDGSGDADRDGTVEVATDGQRLWVRTSGEALERRIR